VTTQDGDKCEDFLFVENAIASSDGKSLALTDGYSVVLKNALSGKTVRRFDNLRGGCLALSPDGKTLAALKGGEVVLFDRDSGKELLQLNPAANSGVWALAFSPDAKSLAVSIREPEFRSHVSIWEIAKLSPVRKRKVETPPMPLEATLTSRKVTYSLNLNGNTPQEFARLVQGWPLPPSPKVDIVLALRNAGTKTLTFHRDILLSHYLTGDGAMNHPMYSYQTEGRPSEEPKKVTLDPGKTFEMPIQSLDCGHAEQSYWLLPGEYTLHARCFIWCDSVPDGLDKLSGKSGHLHLNAPPLRVKVVEEKN
jgi:WD40 repeat protein